MEGLPLYVSKRVTKVWKRISAEAVVEWPLFCGKWKILLLGIILQYAHGVAARCAHFLHRPAPPLRDLGFNILPELGQSMFSVSEVLHTSILISFFVWTFHPFVVSKKQFYTVLLWTKVLTVLVICQFLRVISFSVTQLPGPAPHCRMGSSNARLLLNSWKDVLSLNVTKGCGDLIFSSHMTFMLVCVISYTKHGTQTFFIHLGWCLSVIESLLIISLRKHYSVDIVIAWYVVPLVYLFVDTQLSSIVGSNDVFRRLLTSEDAECSSRGSPLLQDHFEGLEKSLTPHKNGRRGVDTIVIHIMEDFVDTKSWS